MHRSLSALALAACLAQPAVALPVGPFAPMQPGAEAPAAPAAAGMRGFRIDGGTAVDRMNDLTGGAGHAAALGSNAAGTVVGFASDEAGRSAVIWRGGAAPVVLGDLPGGATEAVARAVNAQGRVVGQGRTEAGDRAFLWDAAAGMRPLEALAGAPEGVTLLDATDIDDAGRVVGLAEADGIVQAFLWTPGPDGGPGTLELGMVPGTPFEPGMHVVALSAVHASGAMAGRALSEDGRDRPVLWYSGEVPIDLGDLPGGPETGVAHDVNGLGQVVGASATAAGDRAFVWDFESGMVDLNDRLSAPGGPVLTAAVAVIDDGRILATGTDGDETRFYRLEPVAAEPGAAAPSGAKGPVLALYDVVDLGGFVPAGAPPLLAMDETGRVVGGCVLGMPACPNPLETLVSLGGGTDDGTDVLSLDLPRGEPVEVSRIVPPVIDRRPGPGGSTGGSGDGGGPGGGPGPGGGLPPILVGGGGGSGNDGGGDFVDVVDFPGDLPPDVTTGEVPLPPAGAALLAALGALAALRRRRPAA